MMTDSTAFNRRVRQIGREIFERADTAQPKVWQPAWWLERATHVLDQDDTLKTRAFTFVDCLPSLRTNAAITEHLAEYLPRSTGRVPRTFHAVVGRGPLRKVRENLVGRATRFGASKMAERFITGYDGPSALRTLTRLRRQGMAFTVDVLGEFTTSDKAADRYVNVYHTLMDELAVQACKWPRMPLIDGPQRTPMPTINMSIKLTGMDPHFDAIDPPRAIRNVGRRLRPLLRHAREVGAFINIDMEAVKHRDLTLELFKTVMMEDEFRDWEHVGIVVQAYLVDGERDLEGLLQWGKKRGTRFAVRLVKGAYWDAETAAAVRDYKTPPVWTKKWESDACFERLTRTMLDNTALIRPAFGSHNVRSLAVAIAYAEQVGLAPPDYELQMLYGMGDPLKTAVVEMGRCLRVYCPYGDLMPGMGYLIRRLLENTSNDGFLKQSFSDRSTRDRLLSDPSLERPPSTPLPCRHYENSNPEEPMTAFKNASHTNFTIADDREKMRGAIDYVRDDFGKDYPLVIGSEAVATKSTVDSINPSNKTEIVGRVHMAGHADVDRAVASARKAFTAWRKTRAADRASLLRKLADRMEMRRFEMAATMILEVGKPWREADAEVTEAVDHCRYYAGQIERIESHPRLRNIPGENNMLTYSPKGVCAVISPWAFPMAILTGMTSAALAAGDTVVIKPARQSSVVAAKLMDMIRDVGFPSGVVNFIPGAGGDIGRHLVEHGDVNIVAFTGSHAVGTGVIQSGAVTRPTQPFIKKLIVEMGGQNAIVVDSDAELDGAVQAIIESAFGFAGQKCSSCSRVIVLEEVHDALLQRLKDAVESIVIGPAEEPATMTGPVIDQAAVDFFQNLNETGRKEGSLLVQATLPASCENGFFVPPTIFSGIDPHSVLAQEETFGPLLAVLRAKTFEQAIEIANDTRYALTGGVYSRSPGHIDYAAREFAVGNLYINRRITGSQVDAQPFGGFKLSGTGVKAGSPDYLTHFMDARCITENTLRSGLVPKQQHSEV